MVKISRKTVKECFIKGDNAQTTRERGDYLEQIMVHIFGQIPGVKVHKTKVIGGNTSQEIDIILWNDGHVNGLSMLPNMIFVECKNWSKKISSRDVSWAMTKIVLGGQNFGMLIAANGITGNQEQLNAAHNIIQAYFLKHSVELLVFTRSELESISDTNELISLIKDKKIKLVSRSRQV